MVISIFTPPEEGKEWNECKTGDICDCLTFEYEKFFNGVGTFTLELPITTRFRDMVVVGSVLVTSDGDALIVKNIQTTLDKIKVTGYDLNGLLADRITLATDDDGTAPVDGTTEYCVKRYVESNLYACESDPNRNLPRFAVAENLDRGDPSDHNMPRYAKVNDVVTEMCGAAKLGWRVSLAENAGGSNPVFVFDVAEQVDRSVNQSDRNRVIFSVQQHNVSSMTREVGVTAAKNALYLDIDGTVVAYPQAVEGAVRDVAVGYSRREEYCALSGNSLEYSEFSVEAEQNIADRMAETDSLTIEAGNPLDYRQKYDVGTIATVYDRERSLQLDSVISAVTVRRSGSEYSVKLTLGESKPKLLDQYAKKGEVVGRTVRNEVPKIASSGSASALTEYEYLTDLSAKLNGVTYTAEKDETTGLISRISDDAGNEFEPTINSGITDTAFHNAVFMAVAMIKRFGKAAPVDPTGGYAVFIPDGIDIANMSWHDSVGGHDMDLYGSPVFGDNGIKLSGNNTYGKVVVDEPQTIYAVFKGSRGGSNSWTPIVCKGVTSQTYGAMFDIFLGNSFYITGTGGGSDLISGITSDNWHVVCITRSAASSSKLYIDGSLVGSFTANYGSLYLGFYTINQAFRSNAFNNAGDFVFRYLSFGSQEHAAEQVVANSTTLKSLYGT